MSTRTIIHYQTALQTPLCYNGRTENVTYELPKVTCRNCLAVKEFCLAHAYKGKVATAQYPPRILVEFYIPAGTDKRKRTVAHNIGPTMNEPNYIQVAVPTADDLECFAAFIGELAESLRLKPWRPRRSSDATLDYELRPDYKETGRIKQEGE